MNPIDQQLIQRAKSVINEAEYIVIGGGAGLSAAAGIEYSGDRFTSNFQPFIEKYGLTDMYSSGFYPFQTQEERWAYWARHISLNRYEAASTGYIPICINGCRTVIIVSSQLMLTANLRRQDFLRIEYLRFKATMAICNAQQLVMINCTIMKLRSRRWLSKPSIAEFLRSLFPNVRSAAGR